MIFEVQRREKARQETLIVVDDIADSFDYQNKYAIIQYLKDISEDKLCKLIIMTHNFDFFRTVQSRFVGHAQCLMGSTSEKEISLLQAEGIQNVFVNIWKRQFFKNARMKIACIPSCEIWSNLREGAQSRFITGLRRFSAKPLFKFSYKRWGSGLL